MKKSSVNKNKMYDLVARLIIGIGCGIVFGILLLFSYAKYHPESLTILKICLVFICGFIIGASYGIWHAYIGWKRNDSQLIDDNEFGIH